jgi:hypothetical protein
MVFDDLIIIVCGHILHILLHTDLWLSGGAWYGFGYDHELVIEVSAIANNSAACCYASGYGSQLPSNTTLICADTDSGTATLVQH